MLSSQAPGRLHMARDGQTSGSPCSERQVQCLETRSGLLPDWLCDLGQTSLDPLSCLDGRAGRMRSLSTLVPTPGQSLEGRSLSPDTRERHPARGRRQHPPGTHASYDDQYIHARQPPGRCRAPRSAFRGHFRPAPGLPSDRVAGPASPERLRKQSSRMPALAPPPTGLPKPQFPLL